MELYLTRTLSGLTPTNDSDLELLKRIKLGDTIKCKITKPRNYQFHKKMFALLNLVFNNQDFSDNFDEFREAVIIASGFYFYQKQLDGSEIKRAKSISYAKMDELEFSELYQRVLDVCCKVIGVTSQEIEQELVNFM